MGTNVGTTVTNTIVAFFHITNKDNFRRALSGATVHDMFNWLTIVVLLPVEAATGYLFHLSKAIVDKIQVGNEDDDVELLEVITRPCTSKVIQVDTRGINLIALRGSAYNVDTLQKLCCGRIRFRDTPSNSTEPYCDQECSYLFFDTGMNDYALGVVLLILSLAILCICSVSIAKILHSLLYGNIKKWIHVVVNGEFPGKAKYFTGYLALLFGIGLTMLVESSSIFTSCITPLAGAGMIKIDRVYPLTLGSNIGTTITMLMTTLTRYGNLQNFRNVLQIAFYHFFFNISGFVIFYPIPIMRWPLRFAKFLGERAAKYRWFAFVYLIIVFLLLPFSVFYLSVAGWYVLVAIYTPILVIAMIIIIVKVIQNKKPGILPRKLQNWKFLPEPLRSLDPYDRTMCRPFNVCCRQRCHCCKKYEEGENTNKYVVKTNDENVDTEL